MKKHFCFVVLFVLFSINACQPLPKVSPTNVPIISESPTEEPISETATVEPIIFEPVTLRYNAAKLPSYAPIYLAEMEGYFERFGIILEPISFNRANEAIPLLASGDLDIYAGTVNAGLLNVLGMEPNVKVVADRGSVVENSCTYQAVLVRKDLFESGVITKPEDLKGQIVASSTAGPGGFILSNYLALGGLTLDDVQISDIPTGSYIDAFANKSVAAIVTTELHVTRLLDAGNATVVARLEDFGSFQLSAIAFGKKLTVDDRELGVRFLAAYLLGVAKYNEGKTEENVMNLAEATGEDPQLLRTSCWIPIRLDGKIDFKGIDIFQQWSIEQKQLDAPISEEQFWDPAFLEEAYALIGNN